MEPLVDSPLDGARALHGTSPHPVPPGLGSGLAKTWREEQSPGRWCGEAAASHTPLPSPFPSSPELTYREVKYFPAELWVSPVLVAFSFSHPGFQQMKQNLCLWKSQRVLFKDCCLCFSLVLLKIIMLNQCCLNRFCCT